MGVWNGKHGFGICAQSTTTKFIQLTSPEVEVKLISDLNVCELVSNKARSHSRSAGCLRANAPAVRCDWVL